jgi:hypothetical protein
MVQLYRGTKDKAYSCIRTNSIVRLFDFLRVKEIVNEKNLLFGTMQLTGSTLN